MSFKGFTLAEVLITLGIIGVVAAMTMPTLINATKNAELKTASKKGYSVVTQAIQSMSEEYGSTVTSEDFTSGQFKNDFMKQFIVTRDCGFGERDSGEGDPCVINGSGKSFDGYKTYNGKNGVDLRKMDDGQFITNDGLMILIQNNADPSNFDPQYKALYITIDVNGFKKGPNRWGKDLLTFQLMHDGKLLPMGVEGTDFTGESYCSGNSTSSLNGIACAAKVFNDKNFY